MLEAFAAALSRLNPRLGAPMGDVPRAGGSAAKSDGDPTGLFECPSCGAVYIARDKQRCTGCGVAVTSLDATY